MTQEDIVRMAREAGYGEAMSELHGPALERFAALVAAAERADAERYRWLRDPQNAYHDAWNYFGPNSTAAEIDAAIDAARGEK